jgi:tetratricopeptide (TPR) repeat protein
MKRKKKRPANAHAEPPALSAGKPDGSGGGKAKENCGILGFLPSAWRHGWLLGFFLMAVTLMAYQPVWHAGFIWDDDSMLLNNPLIRQVGGWHRAWFNRAANDFVPATITSLWLEWRLWGANPLGYHLDNVLLHACSALLLWRILLRLKIPGAWLAAALFAVHPVNVESVAWVAQRKNTLAMLLLLASVQCYLTFEDSGKRRWFWLAAGMFLLAVMSKTAVVPLPVVLLGLACWRRGRIERKDVQHSLVFIALAAAGSLMAVWIQQGEGMVVRADSFWSRLAGAGWAAWFYLYKAVLPLNLIFVYPRWQIDARNVLSYIPLVLLAAALVLCWRWGKALFFGLAYFVVMLLPVLGFLNISFMRYSLVADHWEYFAIIGPIALAAAILIRKPVLAAALLLALGALTWRQCGMYANAETLWQTTLRLNPDCWLAHNAIGFDLLQKGKVDEAIAHYQKALQIKPDFTEAHNNLGIVLLQKGRVDEAMDHFQAALEIKPNDAEAHYNLGIALDQKGRVDEAIAHYQKALQIKPDHVDAHYNLGDALLQKGRVDEAIDHFQTVLEIKPDYAEANYNLGVALDQKGRVDEAIVQYQKALQIKPDRVDARVNLGVALFRKGNVDEAIGHFQKALQSEPDNANIHNSLGTAFLQKERVDEAIGHFQKALQSEPDSADAHYGLGIAFSKIGKMDEAITQYHKVLRIAPVNPIVQNNLAWLLATCPEASLRDGKEAVDLAHQANVLTGGEKPIILHARCRLRGGWAVFRSGGNGATRLAFCDSARQLRSGPAIARATKAL